jgi:hypothetical protein
VHTTVRLAAVISALLSSAAFAGTPALQVSVIRADLTYQSSFIDIEQFPDAPFQGSLSSWVGRSLAWEFRSTFPDPLAQSQQATEFGGTTRDWFLPGSAGIAAPRDPGGQTTFINGLSLSTFDSQEIPGFVLPGVPAGARDGLLWSGWGQGAVFVPAPGCEPGNAFCPVRATGFQYAIELVGSDSMLTTPNSPTLSPDALDISQVRLVTLVARQWVDDTIVGTAGVTGSLDTMQVVLKPDGALSITAIPEPSTWLTMLAGLAALGVGHAQRRRP